MFIDIFDVKWCPIVKGVNDFNSFLSHISWPVHFQMGRLLSRQKCKTFNSSNKKFLKGINRMKLTQSL